MEIGDGPGIDVFKDPNKPKLGWWRLALLVVLVLVVGYRLRDKLAQLWLQIQSDSEANLDNIVLCGAVFLFAFCWFPYFRAHRGWAHSREPKKVKKSWPWKLIWRHAKKWLAVSFCWLVACGLGVGFLWVWNLPVPPMPEIKPLGQALAPEGVVSFEWVCVREKSEEELRVVLADGKMMPITYPVGADRAQLKDDQIIFWPDEAFLSFEHQRKLEIRQMGHFGLYVLDLICISLMLFASHKLIKRRV
ncbi:MAG: hypothetical protein AAB415_02055 [Patescibacteria group bacterium]